MRPFYEQIMPVARQRGVGVLGMKVMAYGFLADVADEAVRFVTGLDGVSAALVGVDDVEQLEQNVAAARNGALLTDDQRSALLADARRAYEQRKDEAWFIDV